MEGSFTTPALQYPLFPFLSRGGPLPGGPAPDRRGALAPAARRQTPVAPAHEELQRRQQSGGGQHLPVLPEGDRGGPEGRPGTVREKGVLTGKNIFFFAILP